MKGRDNTGCGEVHLCVLANDARRGVCESSSERKIVGYSVIGFRAACCIHTNIRRENAEMDAGIVLHHAGTVTVLSRDWHSVHGMIRRFGSPLWLGRLSIKPKWRVGKPKWLNGQRCGQHHPHQC
jgi:hypothetical protein